MTGQQTDPVMTKIHISATVQAGCCPDTTAISNGSPIVFLKKPAEDPASNGKLYPLL
ncbi:MAG: hypothetical protein A4E45_00255 [Methanosaeta sp. PtaB.Bin039]|nr:MAG: hypothetical protein A4E45_00255 [Methanosaeta sp. PtaB.Bin039]OPY45381.1 MAG: hypothetical protein A4E47_01005 [Methanosaeta sp. PtaU1.Bin028]